MNGIWVRCIGTGKESEPIATPSTTNPATAMRRRQVTVRTMARPVTERKPFRRQKNWGWGGVAFYIEKELLYLTTVYVVWLMNEIPVRGVAGMIRTGGKAENLKESLSQSHFIHHESLHWLSWGRNRLFSVTDRRLTAWATVPPVFMRSVRYCCLMWQSPYKSTNLVKRPNLKYHENPSNRSTFVSYRKTEVKGKRYAVKFTLQEVTKAHRGSRGVALLSV